MTGVQTCALPICIAANGDVANKIGTCTAAIVARHYGARVMVVAPKIGRASCRERVSISVVAVAVKKKKKRKKTVCTDHG